MRRALTASECLMITEWYFERIGIPVDRPKRRTHARSDT